MLLTQSQMSIWEDTIDDFVGNIVGELTNVANYSAEISKDNDAHHRATDAFCKMTLRENLMKSLQTLKSSVEQDEKVR